MSGNPIGNGTSSRRRRRLRRGRWWSDMTASGIATILGIALTFGVDSCVTRARERKEMRESLVQAVDNLKERFADTGEYMEIIEMQNAVYVTADSIYRLGALLPDSVCEAFRNTMPYVKISAYDHEFEKIFRGSYELWQLQHSSDSLAFYIGQCYDGLNTVETTCQKLGESLLEKIAVVNASKSFFRSESDREWTLALLDDPEFQYYMAVRRVKAGITSEILKAAKSDYETNVVKRIEKTHK